MTKGTCCLKKPAGDRLWVHYQDDWHLPLITDPEGVSLERIDYLEPAQQPDNWIMPFIQWLRTPTYINSSYRPASVLPGDMVCWNPGF